MALFLKLQRTAETLRLIEDHPRAFMLLCKIALRQGFDGSPALIGARDFAVDDMDVNGLDGRYRRAKQMLSDMGLARFESSKSGTMAWALSGSVFAFKNGVGNGVQNGVATEFKTEQFELVSGVKNGVQNGVATEFKTESKTNNKELINTERTNTPPYIPPEGDDQLKIKNVKLKVGEAAAGTATDGNGLNGHNGQGESKPATRRFVKPTVAEIAAYCLERKNGISAAAFWDSYDSKDWKIGKTPMKDWKAAVRTWERNNFQGFGGARAKQPVAAVKRNFGIN